MDLVNCVSHCIFGLGVAVLLFLAFILTKRMLHRRLSCTHFVPQRWNTLLIDLLDHIHWWFLAVLALWTGFQIFPIPIFQTFLNRLLLLALVLQSGILLTKTITFVSNAAASKTAGQASLAILKIGSLVAVWTILLLFLLNNYGFDITALIAGLGIGGIAIALAVQNVLGDLFGYLSIIIDEPFIIGDLVEIDGQAGYIEKIGLKTTRVKSVSGEQLIFANSNLLNCRLRNLKRMDERRIAFTFGVSFDTPHEKLAQIPFFIKAIILEEPTVTFERACLKEIGHTAVVFEVVYFIQDPNYNVYVSVHQRINLKILKCLGDHSIAIASPYYNF